MQIQNIWIFHIILYIKSNINDKSAFSIFSLKNEPLMDWIKFYPNITLLYSDPISRFKIVKKIIPGSFACINVHLGRAQPNDIVDLLRFVEECFSQRTYDVFETALAKYKNKFAENPKVSINLLFPIQNNGPQNFKKNSRKQYLWTTTIESFI